jgi:hypothetical protein
MRSKRRLSPSASRLISIVSSIAGVDILEKTRRRPVVEARGVFYKIYKDIEGWSLADIGALFGKDHATVMHGISTIEDLMSNDESLKTMYDRCISLYRGSTILNWDMDKKELVDKVSSLDNRILDLNSYISEMEAKVEKLNESNAPWLDFKELISTHVPLPKREEAKKKIRAVLNGL